MLVDNASTDGTREAVNQEFPNVHVVYNRSNAGVAGGRNIGIAYAGDHFAYDYLFYNDNDTVVSKDFLGALVVAMEADPRIGIAAPKLHILDEENRLDSAGGADISFWTGQTGRRGYGEIDQGQYDGPAIPPCVPAGIAMARRTVIEKCDGFDAQFNPYGPEDLDFSLRVKEQGYSFRYVPESIVYHKGNKTGFGAYNSDYAALKGRNLRKFLKRHASPLQWYCFHLLLPFLGLRTICRELIKGNFKAPFQLVRGYWIAIRSPSRLATK